MFDSLLVYDIIVSVTGNKMNNKILFNVRRITKHKIFIFILFSVFIFFSKNLCSKEEEYKDKPHYIKNVEKKRKSIVKDWCLPTCCFPSLFFIKPQPNVFIFLGSEYMNAEIDDIYIGFIDLLFFFNLGIKIRGKDYIPNIFHEFKFGMSKKYHKDYYSHQSNNLIGIIHLRNINYYSYQLMYDIGLNYSILDFLSLNISTGLGYISIIYTYEDYDEIEMTYNMSDGERLLAPIFTQLTLGIEKKILDKLNVGIDLKKGVDISVGSDVHSEYSTITIKLSYLIY